MNNEQNTVALMWSALACGILGVVTMIVSYSLAFKTHEICDDIKEQVTSLKLQNKILIDSIESGITFLSRKPKDLLSNNSESIIDFKNDDLHEIVIIPQNK